MSEPLEILERKHIDTHGVERGPRLAQVVKRLNAAIDRINAQDGRIMTLEAENKELRHLWDQNEGWLVELKVAYEGHTHELHAQQSGGPYGTIVTQRQVTTPPTNNGTRGVRDE